MKAFAIAEHTDAARELAAGARTIADEVILVMIDGAAPDASADKVASIAVPEGVAAECAADTVVALFDAEQPGIVLVEPTRRLKVIAGALAAHAGTSVITDAMSIAADGAATSMFFGGVAERVQKSAGPVAIYTVGAGVFADAAASGANEALPVEWVAPKFAVEVVSRTPIEKSGVDLAKADAVVSAGRGFAEKADLDLAYALADKLGAAVGCSRPLAEGVDWFPHEAYIGVSGQVIAPKVFLAAGISGQMQHMVGCNRSGAVFAVNKDKNAPIFKQCDYGLVGDLKTVLPAVVAAL